LFERSASILNKLVTTPDRLAGITFYYENNFQDDSSANLIEFMNSQFELQKEKKEGVKTNGMENVGSILDKLVQKEITQTSTTILKEC